MAKQSMADVCVIGAGPAGTAAAISLADAGLDTLLVDKAEFPRDKTCGDGLTTRALHCLRELGLATADLLSWTPIDAAVVHPPGGAPVRLDLPDDEETYAAIARRAELDGALARLALRAGAHLRTGVAVTNVGSRNGRVTVDCNDGSTVTARHAVVAAGASGHSTTDGDMHATRVYVRTSSPLPPEAHVWFRPDVLPGYAWLLPIGNEANIGVAVHRRNRSPRHAVQATRRLLESEWLARIIGDGVAVVDRVRSWRIPSTLSVRRSADGILYVGDAAGMVDPMTGEGIGPALRSGMLAAEAITRAHRRGSDAAGAYRTAALRAHFADHLTSRLALRPLSHPRTAAAAVRFMGSDPRLSRYFARWMWEDVERASVLSPPAFVRSLRSPRGVVFDG